MVDYNPYPCVVIVAGIERISRWGKKESGYGNSSAPHLAITIMGMMCYVDDIGLQRLENVEVVGY